MTATSVARGLAINSSIIETASFDLTFLDACVDSSLISLSTTPQTMPSPSSYDGQTTFTFTPYTVSPDWCEVNVTCNTVNGPSEYLSCLDIDDSSNQINWTFDSNDYNGGLTPG